MFLRVYLFQALVLIIAGFSLLELLMYLKVVKHEINKPAKRYLRDYEALLCSAPPPKTWPKNTTAPCPNKGIVTAFNHWGLFTTMWQYANVISASINIQMRPYLPVCMKETLERVFNELPVPTLSEIGHCFLPLPESAKNIQTWTNMSQSIVFKATDLYSEAVVEFLEVVRHHFTFKSALSDFATSFLLSAKENRTKATFVGVYITRTSIIVNQEYDNIFPNPQFFIDAMNYFRVKYPYALFVTITDRKGFWENFFRKQDVVVVDEDSLEPFGAALAVLSKCNHTILSSDDIAIWAAILSGGEAVVSVSLLEEFYLLIQNQKNWTYLLQKPKAVNKILERR